MADEAVVQARARAACVTLAALVAAETYPGVARGMLDHALSYSLSEAPDTEMGVHIARAIVMLPVSIEVTPTGIVVFPSATSEMPRTACDKRPIIRTLAHVVHTGVDHCFGHVVRNGTGDVVRATQCLVAAQIAAAAPRGHMLDVVGGLIPRVLTQMGSVRNATAILCAVYAEVLRDPLVAQGRPHDPHLYARYYTTLAEGTPSVPASPVSTPTTPLVPIGSPPAAANDALHAARNAVLWADGQYLAHALPAGVSGVMVLHQMGMGTGQFLARLVAGSAPGVATSIDTIATPLAILTARLAAVPLHACMPCRVLCHRVLLTHTPARAWEGMPAPYGSMRAHTGSLPPPGAHMYACTRAAEVPALPSFFLAVLLARYLNSSGATNAWIGSEFELHGFEVVYANPRAIERLPQMRDTMCMQSMTQFTAVRDAFWITIPVPPPDMMPADILAPATGTDVRLALVANVLAALWHVYVPFVRFS